MISVILVSMLTILFSTLKQTFDLWQQPELAFELESDLRDTGLWHEMACWFQCWKNLTSWLDLTCLITGAISVKMNEFVPPRKLEPWFVLWSFFLVRLRRISISLPYRHAYCCHVWAGTRSCYLELLELLFETLDLSSECCKRKSDGYLNWLNWLHFLILEGSLLARYSDRLHDFSVTILRCYKDVYINSFCLCIVGLWNSLPIECFPFGQWSKWF